MDLTFTDAEEAFRAEVRQFLADRLPARISAKVRTGKRPTKRDFEEWHSRDLGAHVRSLFEQAASAQYPSWARGQ